MPQFYEKSTLSLSRNLPLNSKIKNNKSGFTLLEILLVVGIISLLAGIVIVAINPGKQLASVRNTQRKSDLKQLNSAITQYYISEQEYPADVQSALTLTEICDTGNLPGPQDTITCGSLADLSVLVPTYITAIPVDPQGASTTAFINTAYAAEGGTGYYVMKDSNNKLVLNTIKAELGTVIAIGTTTAMIGGGEEIPSTLGNGLIAHYKMNDVNCTTVVDSAGNNDGSGTCTSVAGATANTGTALSFNGSQVGMSAPSNSDFAFGTGDFGIAFWIYATSFDAWSAIFGQSNSWSQSGGWIIQAREGNRIGIGIPNINDNLPSSGSLNINQWNSVIIFRNSGIVSYYYNGNLVDSKSYTASWDLKNYLLIGNGGMSFRLDDLRIYNRFLTTDEISELAAGTEAE